MYKSTITNLLAALVIAAGYLSPWYGDHIRTVGFFALSGALTNWLAVHMLFERVPLLYGSGVIPANFESIKAWIRQLIMAEFFTQENLHRFFSQQDRMLSSLIDVEAAAARLDYDRIYDTLTGEVLNSRFGGMLGMFGGEGLLERYRETFKVKVQDYIVTEVSDPAFFPSLIGETDLTGVVRDKVDTIVEQRLEELTPEIVKIMMKDLIKRHLGWLVVWGGVFGGLIGLGMSFIP